MENCKICHCDVCVELRGTKYVSMSFYEALEYFDFHDLTRLAHVKKQIILKRNPNKDWKELLQQQITAIQFRMWILKIRELNLELDMILQFKAAKEAKLCARG